MAILDDPPDPLQGKPPTAQNTEGGVKINVRLIVEIKRETRI
jgi:hypothetical protein